MKIRLLFSSIVAVALSASAFAQGGPISPSTVLSVKPNDGRPVVFSNEADLFKIAPLKIEALRIEIASLNVDSERLVYLKEMLWRFENAVIFSKKDVFKKNINAQSDLKEDDAIESEVLKKDIVFPQFVNTGNPEEDLLKYEALKKKYFENTQIVDPSIKSIGKKSN